MTAGAQPPAVGEQRVVVRVADVDRLLGRARGQVTGSLPVNGPLAEQHVGDAVALAAGQPGGDQRVDLASWSVMTCGRPETTSTTHFACAAQTLSIAARSPAEVSDLLRELPASGS